MTGRPEPENFTKDGKCSRCGGCCASILPLSEADVKRLRKFAKKKNITPKLPDGDDVIYLHCPFLAADPVAPGQKRCLCYEVRPMVCRTFSCANSNQGNAKAWLDKAGSIPLPEPMNAWAIFNRTGLRIQGQEIPYAAAPRCRVSADDGREFEFAVGRPVSLELTDGRTIPPSLVLNISRGGLQVFNAAEHHIETVGFDGMAQVLSEACIVSGTAAGTESEADDAKKQQ